MDRDCSHDAADIVHSSVDGDHQTLLQLPGDWRESTADGTIWKQSLHWYDSSASPGFENADVESGIGTLFRASQFLSEELPIRLAHRVQELSDLPDGLNEMESIKRVQDWYAQSFEVRRDTATDGSKDMTVDSVVRKSPRSRSRTSAQRSRNDSRDQQRATVNHAYSARLPPIRVSSLGSTNQTSRASGTVGTARTALRTELQRKHEQPPRGATLPRQMTATGLRN